MNCHILAIDQGTTSTRAMIFSAAGRCVVRAQRELKQIYPRDGWVEHDPEEIWAATLTVCREALKGAAAAGISVAGIGMTNQRETTLIWNRETGKPIYNAIVWQDRRTADHCSELKDQGYEAEICRTTGLLLDPYFSATKICWLLDNVAGARQLAERGELAFGTIDSFLLWRLTNGRSHLTDVTNASRTLLMNLEEQRWDERMLEIFEIPAAMLPEIRDCAADFGDSEEALLGVSLPIVGIAGDQQAATIGQACFEPGMIKATYGTGCFVLLNTGEKICYSGNRLVTTLAYRLGGQSCYALEGSIFAAGSAIQWLRDGLGLIQSADEVEALAGQLKSNRGVYMVPAFTGLGAPYWDPQARGALFGLTRDSGKAEIARATLESIAYQTKDLIEALEKDSGKRIATLRVDGGMTGNRWLIQFIANILGIPVARPVVAETTALGAAFLAALQLGVYTSLDEIAETWQAQEEFVPDYCEQQREGLLAGWRKAVARTLES